MGEREREREREREKYRVRERERGGREGGSEREERERNIKQLQFVPLLSFLAVLPTGCGKIRGKFFSVFFPSPPPHKTLHFC